MAAQKAQAVEAEERDSHSSKGEREYRGQTRLFRNGVRRTAPSAYGVEVVLMSHLVERCAAAQGGYDRVTWDLQDHVSYGFRFGILRA